MDKTLVVGLLLLCSGLVLSGGPGLFGVPAEYTAEEQHGASAEGVYVYSELSETERHAVDAAIESTVTVGTGSELRDQQYLFATDGPKIVYNNETAYRITHTEEYALLEDGMTGGAYLCAMFGLLITVLAWATTDTRVESE